MFSNNAPMRLTVSESASPVVVLLLMMAGTAWGQNDLPLTYKGTCTGNQTDIHDLSAIQDTPAIKCDALTVMQKGSETMASFS